MPRLATLVVFFACAGILTCQTVQLVEPGTVTGRVANALDGSPVKGASVRLMQVRYRTGGGGGRNAPQTTSKADGTFTMDAVDPGSYVVVARCEGFTMNTRSIRSRFLEVKAGQLTADITLQMTPFSTLSGHVLDDQDKPVAAARVIALAQTLYTTGGSIEQQSEAETNKAGAFSLTKLKPGSYFVAAQPPASTGKASTGSGLARTFFPHEADLQASTPVLISPGDSPNNLDIHLRRSAVYHVRGRLSDPAVASFTTITLAPAGLTRAEALTSTVKPEKDGSFDISGVLPGAYTLRALGFGSSPLARQDIQVSAADVSNIVLTPVDSITLNGQVTFEEIDANARPTVQVFAQAMEEQERHRIPSATADADGNFVLRGLDPQLYMLRVSIGGRGLYVKSLAVNQQDVLNQPIDLSTLAGAKVEMVIRSGASQITGTVQALEQGESAMVAFVPERVAPDGSNVTISYTRSDGTFASSYLAPGVYRVYATEGDPNIWRSPDLAREMQPQAEEVTLTEGQAAQVQLQKIPFETVEQAADRVGVSIE